MLYALADELLVVMKFLQWKPSKGVKLYCFFIYFPTQINFEDAFIG